MVHFEAEEPDISFSSWQGPHWTRATDLKDSKHWMYVDQKHDYKWGSVTATCVNKQLF